MNSSAKLSPREDAQMFPGPAGPFAVEVFMPASGSRGPYKKLGVARPMEPVKRGRRTGKQYKKPWLARFIDCNGAERQVGCFASKTEAQAAIADAVSKCNQEAGTTSGTGFPLGHYLERPEHWPEYNSRDPRTVETNQWRISHYILPNLPKGPETTPADITTVVLRLACATLMDQQLSKRTIDGAFMALSALIRDIGELADEDLPNPARKMRAKATDRRLASNREEDDPKYKPAPVGHRAIEPWEFREFLNCADQRHQGVLASPAMSSMRPGELLASNRRHHDPGRQMLYIHEVVTPKGRRKKGLKGTHHIAAFEARGRWVLFPDALMELYAHLPQNIRGYLNQTPSLTFYLHGNFMRDVWNKPMKRAEQAGIQRFTPYDLRHSFATWLGHAGLPEVAIAAWMGHNLIKTGLAGLSIEPDLTTLRGTYMHLLEENRTRALDVLTAILEGKDTKSVSAQ